MADGNTERSGSTEIPEHLFRQSEEFRSFQRTRAEVRAQQLADRISRANSWPGVALAHLEHRLGAPLLTPYVVALVLLAAVILLPVWWALTR